MNRDEHLAWCKERAREYLAHGDVANAVASMLSDMNKHPETAPVSKALGGLGLVTAASGDVAAARRFIEGFN